MNQVRFNIQGLCLHQDENFLKSPLVRHSLYATDKNQAERSKGVQGRGGIYWLRRDGKGWTLEELLWAGEAGSASQAQAC